MTYHPHYYQPYPTSAYGYPQPGGVAVLGVTGALLAGSMAAAQAIRKVKNKELDNAQALSQVAKESLGAGIATAAGAAVGKTLFQSGPLSLAAMIAVSIGVKYAYDELLMPKTAERPTAPAKTSKSK